MSLTFCNRLSKYLLIFQSFHCWQRFYLRRTIKKLLISMTCLLLLSLTIFLSLLNIQLLYTFYLKKKCATLLYHICILPSKSPVARYLCCKLDAPNVPHLRAFAFSICNRKVCSSYVYTVSHLSEIRRD